MPTLVPPQSRTAVSASPDKSLTKVLGKSEYVQDLVEECAAELSVVNDELGKDLATREKTVAVEDKVQEAAAELTSVNAALEHEIEERHHLELRLAAVTEQGDVARHASLHDRLTGLPNRALFDDRLQHGLAQAERHDRTLAVMFVDLDGFKRINDAHGHEVGDGILRLVARRLEENTRKDDTVSRHGGDEFLYLLMEVSDESTVAAIAAKIVAVIQAPAVLDVRGTPQTFRVSASVGIAVYPKDGTSAEALIEAADRAMYEAKRAGGGHSFGR